MEKKFRSINRALRRGSLKIEIRELPFGQMIPVMFRRSSRTPSNKVHKHRVRWVEYSF